MIFCYLDRICLLIFHRFWYAIYCTSYNVKSNIHTNTLDIRTINGNIVNIKICLHIFCRRGMPYGIPRLQRNCQDNCKIHYIVDYIVNHVLILLNNRNAIPAKSYPINSRSIPNPHTIFPFISHNIKIYHARDWT